MRILIMEKVRKISHATIIGLILVITLTSLALIAAFTSVQVAMPASFAKYYEWLLLTMCIALIFYTLFIVHPKSDRKYLYEGIAYLCTATGLIEIATTIRSYPPLDGTSVISGFIAIYYAILGIRYIKYHHYVERIKGNVA